MMTLPGHKSTKQAQQAKPTEQKKDLTFPEEVDWRNEGCVAPVRNQASCGSCWAFATTATMESSHCINSGKLLDLSEE